MTISSKKPVTPPKHEAVSPPLFKGDILAKGIVTSVAVSIINHTGRTVLNSLARHPLIMFGLGVTTGYFTHKYRKRILAVSSQAADESKHFVLRQKEHLLDLFAENQDNTEEQDHSK